MGFPRRSDGGFCRKISTGGFSTKVCCRSDGGFRFSTKVCCFYRIFRIFRYVTRLCTRIKHHCWCGGPWDEEHTKNNVFIPELCFVFIRRSALSALHGRSVGLTA